MWGGGGVKGLQDCIRQESNEMQGEGYEMRVCLGACVDLNQKKHTFHRPCWDLKTCK